MTVKEIEAQSGLPRASIRFYEQKGLLSPARRENGYRDYSAADVETLRRIVLLRSLGVSIEEIRAAQHGEKALDAILQERLSGWQKQQEKAAQAAAVCRAIRADGATWDTLQVERYQGITAGSEQPQPPAPPIEDRLPYPALPWRRFFARLLDEALYGLLWKALLGLVLHVNLNTYSRSLWGSLLDGAVLAVLTLLIEPQLLHCFGTTAGKRLFGLRLEAAEGGKPSRAAAGERTLNMLRYGEGFWIPVWQWVRLWRSCRTCQTGEQLPWDAQSELIYTVRDTARWRGGAFVFAMACVSAFSLAIYGQNALPPCRGALTVAQFARNYNEQLHYYGQESALYLDENGQWQQRQETGAVIVWTENASALPQWHFEVDAEGILRSVRFTVDAAAGAQGGLISGLQSRVLTAALALMGAQPQVNAFSFAPQRIARALRQAGGLTDCDLMLFGVHLIYTVEQQGFAEVDDWLIGSPNAALHARLSMTVE